MSEVKVTKRERFLELRTLVEGESIRVGEDMSDLLGFIDHEIDLLARKHSTKSGKTPAQVENDAIKATLADVLSEVSSGARATELAAELGLSVQKVSALLRQMVADGVVVRTTEKKVTTFTLA
jgi:predicted Rossmann fold nucleotide-binding protein DprA/Smf involved in DNA uptake